MLTREVMGLLALAILWVNTLLIVAAAAKELAALARKRRLLRPLGPGRRGEGVIEGRVVRGDGPGGVLAAQSIDQIGRSAGDSDKGRGILFADRSFSGEIFGGAISVELEAGRPEEVEIAPASRAEVWLPLSALRAASACPSAERFDQAFDEARKARGFARTVTAGIEPGATVWITGDLDRERGDGPLRLTPARGLDPVASTLDPGALCSRKIALSVASIGAILALAAGATALALQAPRFGLISTIGGALCFIFFLLVQPAGTALRDAVRLPNRAFLRGSWQHSSARSEKAALGELRSGS